MGSYLNILTKVGPSPAEIAKKADAEVKAGAKEEIADAQARIAELKEDPSKTYNRGPIMVEEDIKELKKGFECAIEDVAVSIMCNAEKESESVKNYTDLIFKLKKLIKHCSIFIRKLNEPRGPEMGLSETEIKSKIDYYTRILEWSQNNIVKTQDKIQDELNHNSALLADYIEFTGIKPDAEGIKEIAKTISN